MIGTFIDLTGQTFVREIKKLEKIIKYVSSNLTSDEMIKALFEQREIPKATTRTQTYVLQSVTNNIPVYKEILEPYTNAATIAPKPIVMTKEDKVTVQPTLTVDTSFEDMYKKLKG